MKTNEPAEQQIVVQLLDELAFTADGIQNLKKQRSQDLLRRNRGPAILRIQLVQISREILKDFVYNGSHSAKWMIFRDPPLHRNIAENHSIICIIAAHDESEIARLKTPGFYEFFSSLLVPPDMKRYEFEERFTHIFDDIERPELLTNRDPVYTIPSRHNWRLRGVQIKGQITPATFAANGQSPIFGAAQAQEIANGLGKTDWAKLAGMSGRQFISEEITFKAADQTRCGEACASAIEKALENGRPVRATLWSDTGGRHPWHYPTIVGLKRVKNEDGTETVRFLGNDPLSPESVSEYRGEDIGTPLWSLK